MLRILDQDAFKCGDPIKSIQDIAVSITEINKKKSGFEENPELKQL